VKSNPLERYQLNFSGSFPVVVVTGFDQLSGCQFHDGSGVAFNFVANGSRAWKAHGPASDRVFRKSSRSSCVPRGSLHGGDDLVGSWIENEILAGHE
jgi:hypothetical protein